MSAKTNKTKIPPQPQIRNAADFKSIYTNYAQTAASPADISLGVGEASPTETGVVEVEMKARLVMAPMQAKIMLGMLLHVIKQYEGQFGTIVVPDVVTAQLGWSMPKAQVPDGGNSTEGD